jgi:hypothetical protein
MRYPVFGGVKWKVPPFGRAGCDRHQRGTSAGMKGCCTVARTNKQSLLRRDAAARWVAILPTYTVPFSTALLLGNLVIFSGFCAWACRSAVASHPAVIDAVPVAPEHQTPREGDMRTGRISQRGLDIVYICGCWSLAGRCVAQVTSCGTLPAVMCASGREPIRVLVRRGRPRGGGESGRPVSGSVRTCSPHLFESGGVATTPLFLRAQVVG